MKPQTITQTAATSAANSAPVRMNWRNPIVDMSLNTDGSTTGWTVYYTLTPPDGYATGAAWISGGLWTATDISGATADTQASLNKAVQGIYLACDANGTDTAILQIVQPTG